MQRLASALSILLPTLAAAAPPAPLPAGWVEAGLRASERRFARVLKEAEALRAQVLVGVIEAGEAGPRLVHDAWRADAEYFYPASAIKLCGAVVALAELGALTAREPALGRETRLTWHPLLEGERKAARDPSAPGGRITLAWEIRKALVVSDNDAFNRLYEFAGHRPANERLWSAGLGSVRIWHRLNVVRSVEDNRRSPRIDLALPGRRGQVTIAERASDLALSPPELPGLDVGTAYLGGRPEALIEAPMSFRDKNYASLHDLQALLAALIRPEVAGPIRFDALGLGERDRRFLVEVLGQAPATLNPRVWAGAEFEEGRSRPTLPGVLRVRRRDELEVRGKAGRAYGFHVENAYYRDRITGRAFFLSAVLYANPDGVLNDGKYEYGSLSEPFMADLGEVVARAVFGRRPQAGLARPH